MKCHRALVARALFACTVLYVFTLHGVASKRIALRTDRNYYEEEPPDCIYIMEAAEKPPDPANPEIYTKIVCEGVLKFEQRKNLADLEQTELKINDQSSVLLFSIRSPKPSYLRIININFSMQNCSFKNLVPFPDLPTTAPIVIDGGVGIITNSKFVNNGGFGVAGVMHVTGWSTVEVFDSVFEANEGKEVGGIDVATWAEVEGTRSRFVKNVGNLVGDIRAHDTSDLEFEVCDFVGLGPQEDLLRYIKGDIDELPPDTILPKAGAMSMENYARAEIERSNFTNYSAKQGAVSSTDASVVFVIQTQFFDNYMEHGGGLYLFGSYGHYTRIMESSFVSNAAKLGGGVVVLGEGLFSVMNTKFLDNVAQFGGALFGDFANTSLLEHAVCAKSWQGSRMTIQDSTFARNGADYRGGALFSRCSQVIMNKNVLKDNTAGDLGGAVFLDSGFEIDNIKCSYHNNSAIMGGGAIFANNTEKVESENSEYEQNRVRDADGGAIWVAHSREVVLLATHFVENHVKGLGGAVAFWNVSSVIVDQSYVTGNTAGSGGAVAGWLVEEMYVTNMEFKDHHASDLDGGAVAILDSGTVGFRNITFERNTANKSCGALKMLNSKKLVAIDILFSGNKALGENGGGACLDNVDEFEATDVRFGSNNAAKIGGGLYVSDSGVVSLNKTMFDSNLGAEGCGIGAHGLVDFHAFDSFFGSHACGGDGSAVQIRNGSGNFSAVNLGVWLNDAQGNGGGIFAQGFAVMELSNSTFTNNTAGGSGGSMCLKEISEFSANDVQFVSNNASKIGGAIFVMDSGAFGFNSTNFSTNLAQAGCALGADGLVDFHGDNVVISNHSCKGDGGAVQIRNGSGNFTLFNSIVRNNTSQGKGGAIFGEGFSAMTLLETPFTENVAGETGGAMHLENIGNFSAANLRFVENNATGVGGAISVWNSGSFAFDTALFMVNFGTGGCGFHANGLVDFHAIDSAFEDHACGGHGGAIQILNASGQFRVKNSEIENNEAEADGGAVYAEGFAKMDLSGSTFVNNVAGGDGGAFRLTSIGTLEAKDVKIVSNKAQKLGGGIWVEKSGSLSFESSQFESNSAMEGCAILADELVDFNAKGSTFKDHSCGGDGGAIQLLKGSGELSMVDSKAVDNKAEANGGAVYAEGFLKVDLSSSSFKNNAAGGGGGGLRMTSIGEVFAKDVKIVSNEAHGNGGGIWVDQVGSIWFDAAVFDSNRGTEGCAISVDKVDDFVIVGSTFESQVCAGDGGAVLVRNGTGNFTLFESVVRHNAGVGNGGGVYAEGFVNATISGGEFRNNTAGGRGGGFYGKNIKKWVIEKGESERRRNVLRMGANAVHTTFEDNAAGTSGGGIAFEGADSVKIADALFTSNSADNGGGVFVQDAGVVSLKHTYIQDNDADLSGGGMLVERLDRLNVTGSTISSNTAMENGGGLLIASVANVFLDNIELSDNNAKMAAGLSVSGHSDVIGNRIDFFDNDAEKGGGGFLCEGETSFFLNNSVFEGNYGREAESISALCNCHVNVTYSEFHRDRSRSHNGDFFKSSNGCSSVITLGCVFTGKPWDWNMIITTGLVILGGVSGCVCCCVCVWCVHGRRRRKKELADAELKGMTQPMLGDGNSEEDWEYEDEYEDENEAVQNGDVEAPPPPPPPAQKKPSENKDHHPTPDISSHPIDIQPDEIKMSLQPILTESSEIKLRTLVVGDEVKLSIEPGSPVVEGFSLQLIPQQPPPPPPPHTEEAASDELPDATVPVSTPPLRETEGKVADPLDGGAKPGPSRQNTVPEFWWWENERPQQKPATLSRTESDLSSGYNTEDLMSTDEESVVSVSPRPKRGGLS